MPKIKQELITDSFTVKRKRDRFNGKTEEEVLEMTLPDHLVYGLDIVIIGINPGLTAAYIGHHYAGPGNHFWKCLYLSGLTPEQMNAYDDARLKEFGIGFTNIVARTSRGSADLTKKEIKEGAEILQEKIKKFQPKIAVFNGKGIYEVFCGHKKFFIGKQPEPFPGTDTAVFVMPSSSARCSQLPRAVDKVPFYDALKKLRDHLRGDLPCVEESELIFPDLDLKVEPKKEKVEAHEETNVAVPAKRGRKKKLKDESNSIPSNESNNTPSLIHSAMQQHCNSYNSINNLVKSEPEHNLNFRMDHWMYNPGVPFQCSNFPTVKQEPECDENYGDLSTASQQLPFTGFANTATLNLPQFGSNPIFLHSEANEDSHATDNQGRF